MKMKKKILLISSLVIAALILLGVSLYFYPYYIIYRKFKNPQYLTIIIPQQGTTTPTNGIKYKILDKSDVDAFTSKINFKIFNTISQREIGSRNFRVIGWIEYPDISRRNGNDVGYRINIYDNGYVAFGHLIATPSLTEMPLLKDAFISLKNKYHKGKEISKQ